MDFRNKSVLLFFILAALLAGSWFFLFPIRDSIDPGDLFFEGFYLIVAVGSFLLVQQLEVEKLSWGWSLLTLGLLVGFLGEFSNSSAWIDLYAGTALKSGGLLLMGIGFYTALGETQANEDKYRSLFQEMGDGIALNEILYDNAGMPVDYIFHEVNPAFESLCELSSDEVEGKAASEVYETDEVPLLDVYSVVTETLEPVGFITYFEPLDKHLHVSAFAIERGKFATIFSDISERMATEEKLRGALSELRSTRQQLVDQDWECRLNTIASGIVHEFNNALTTISGFTDLLLNKPEKLEDRDTVLDYLRRMDEAADRAAETVRCMRQFYRPHDEEEHRPLDLNNLVRDAIAMTRPRWKEDAQAHGLNLDVETHLPTVTSIRGSEAELHEMLTHLILSAVDAMEQDGVISISAEEQDDEVRLTVSDTGSGMDEDALEKGLDPSCSPQEMGERALMMSGVHDIVQRHDGRLNVESDPEEGTSVHIAFPLSQEVPEGETAPEETKSCPPLKVLAVEDDQTQVMLLNQMLQDSGHDVDVAGTGEEGLDQFESETYDLIITDRAMPEMGGDELARRAKELAPEQPVIMLTGLGEVMDAKGENPEGVDAVVCKPITLSKLHAAIADVLLTAEKERETS